VTPDEIRQVVFRILGAIAPEADFAALAPQANLRETLDLDSMDFLNFVIALHSETGVDVPEADYSCLSTLAGCIDYLAGHGCAAQEDAR
jgi:acyl carrier protein